MFRRCCISVSQRLHYFSLTRSVIQLGNDQIITYLDHRRHEREEPVENLHAQTKPNRLTTFAEVTEWIDSCSIDSNNVELAWNRLRWISDGEEPPEELVHKLVKWTSEIAASLHQRGFSMIWYSMARLNIVEPDLLEFMAKHALDDSAKFLLSFSPRNLATLLTSIVRIHRLMQISKKAEDTMVFPSEMTLVNVILKQIFTKLNELNEKDLSSVLRALGVLKIDVGVYRYRQLAREAERMIHLARFNNQDLVNVAYGLTTGGKIDLFDECSILVEEMLHASRMADYNINQLTLLLQAFTKTRHTQNKQKLLTPILSRLLREDVVSQLRSFQLRTLSMGLSYFKIDNYEMWQTFSDRLMDENGFDGVSVFDLSVVLHSMGVVRLMHRPLLDKIVQHMIQNNEAMMNLNRAGLSSCLFGLGSFKHKNSELLQILTQALDRESILQALTPKQMTNILFSLGQVNHAHKVVHSIINRAVQYKDRFENHDLAHILFALTQGIFSGSVFDVTPLFEEFFKRDRLPKLENTDLSMALCATGKLKPEIRHRWKAIVMEVTKEWRLAEYAVIDLIQIVKAVQELQYSVPQQLEKCLSEPKQSLWMRDLPNRALIDYVSCVSVLSSPLTLSKDLQMSFKEAVSEQRVRQYSAREVVDLTRSMKKFCYFHPEPIALLAEELIERAIVIGYLPQLPSLALYRILSTFAVAKYNKNRPLLLSLAVECCRRERLNSSSSFELTGIFHSLSALEIMQKWTWKALMEQILSPNRLEQYSEMRVVQILLGLSISGRGDGKIVDQILSSFLSRNSLLQPVTISIILYNLTLFDCEKHVYAEKIMNEITRRSDLRIFTTTQIGKILYSMAKLNIHNEAVMKLVCREIRSSRLESATNTDVCNLIDGCATFSVSDKAVVASLLATALRTFRCESYTNGQLTRLFQKFAEWGIVNPCQLAGLVEALLQNGRSETMSSFQVLSVLKSLMRLDLLQPRIVDQFLAPIFGHETRLTDMSVHDLHELHQFLMITHIPGANERVQIALADKQIKKWPGYPYKEITTETSVGTMDNV